MIDIIKLKLFTQ